MPTSLGTLGLVRAVSELSYTTTQQFYHLKRALKLSEDLSVLGVSNPWRPRCCAVQRIFAIVLNNSLTFKSPGTRQISTLYAWLSQWTFTPKGTMIESDRGGKLVDLITARDPTFTSGSWTFQVETQDYGYNTQWFGQYNLRSMGALHVRSINQRAVLLSAQLKKRVCALSCHRPTSYKRMSMTHLDTFMTIPPATTLANWNHKTFAFST
ncbi:uncharacterized protein LACBIDRAFT_324633 [Laccaria bicolor S238N-H82]|uniref:Predicted protein n=1 Tax=Laccaria bicolor (strain S238N-H82 / ATCC MYA-4686) TaxID=486041 RepID=B0D2J4_LACBS|nr:uncharacterized protein LACBIDRAFT_324633 [Laccaria bicolor S238N-H82]EDR11107.1 predicted protein [Laccaria bicolor S238N-H82]|eukprot:XP_001878408.1 predicted protein [Laccaria bicolor S238N-H82]